MTLKSAKTVLKEFVKTPKINVDALFNYLYPKPTGLIFFISEKERKQKKEEKNK